MTLLVGEDVELCTANAQLGTNWGTVKPVCKALRLRKLTVAAAAYRLRSGPGRTRLFRWVPTQRRFEGQLVPERSRVSNLTSLAHFKAPVVPG